MSRLEELSMEDCSLTEMDAGLIASNTELRTIQLGGNRLASLSQAFFKKQVSHFPRYQISSCLFSNKKSHEL